MKKFNIILGLLLIATMSLAEEIGISEAIKKAGLEELAATYSKDKIERSLGEVDYKSNSLEELQEMALLVDLDFIDADKIGETQDLSYMVSVFEDQPKNYLGNVSDKSIYEKVLTSWNNATMYRDEKLIEDLVKELKKGTYTGYNIKRKDDSSNFDKELTITYGHSNIAHAIQLIALMKTENLEARVQLEPKTSSYLYMKDWGTPGKREGYFVDTSDDIWVAYAKEYDMSFEFDSIEARDRFDSIINEYAKKDSTDEQGLIVASWWQPLYHSRLPLDGYKKLIDNISDRGEYEIHIFSLEDKSPAIMKSLDTEIKREIFVNPAFYNYMLGGYK